MCVCVCVFVCVCEYLPVSVCWTRSRLYHQHLDEDQLVFRRKPPTAEHSWILFLINSPSYKHAPSEHFIRNTPITLAGSCLCSQTVSGLCGLDPAYVRKVPLRFWFHVDTMHHISSAVSCGQSTSGGGALFLSDRTRPGPGLIINFLFIYISKYKSDMRPNVIYQSEAGYWVKSDNSDENRARTVDGTRGEI